MKRDQNYVAKMEKAIAQKYGEKAIQNPKANWNEEKEKDYIEQVKELSEREYRHREAMDKIEKDGFLISKKLLNKESKRNCPVCNIYSFSSRDDIYMNKYECCYNCYLSWVYEYEERWLNGWRPNNENNKK